MQKTNQFTLGLVAAGMAAASLTTLSAQDAPPNPEAWKSSAGLNFSLTQGNAENLLIGATFNTTKKWSQNEFNAGADVSYGETTSKTVVGGAVVENDETTVNNFGGFLDYNRLLSDRFYLGIRGDGRQDQIADVDYRFSLNSKAGYYLLKDEKFQLSVEAGPGYVWEKLAGNADDFATLRFGEKFTWQISKSARFFQDLEYVPEISDWGNYIVQGQAGVEADLTTKLALRVVLQDTYRSRPAPFAGTVPLTFREKNDVKLLAGITYKF